MFVLTDINLSSFILCRSISGINQLEDEFDYEN
jgi:hypothetical protein